MYNELQKFPVCADNGELGANGFLKIQGYHEMICNLIEQNEISNGGSIAETLKKGFAWAIISLSIEVEKPIASCEWLTGQTWLSELPDGVSPFYRREVQFFAQDGSVMFSASLFLVRLDTTTHKIIRQPDNEKATVSPYGKTVENAAARIHEHEKYEHFDSRRIYPSDIDVLGHLNNCRYGSMVYDAAVALGHDFTSRPFSYTINFLRQYMPDSTVELFIRQKSDKLCICGGENPEAEGRKNFIAYLSVK